MTYFSLTCVFVVFQIQCADHNAFIEQLKNKIIQYKNERNALAATSTDEDTNPEGIFTLRSNRIQLQQLIRNARTAGRITEQQFQYLKKSVDQS